MSLYVSIIGIDGSGKSTVTPALAHLVAAERGVTAAAVGEEIRCRAPDQDLVVPGFTPDGDLLSARLGRLFRRGAKAATRYRRLYPPLKLIHLAVQERTVRRLVTRYAPEVIFSEGNLILSAAGRAINYIDPGIGPSTDLQWANPVSLLQVLYEYVTEGEIVSRQTVQAIPGLRLMRWLQRLDAWLGLDLTRLPDALVFLDIAPETALARLKASGQRLDRHENLRDLEEARTMYRDVVSFFRDRAGERNAIVIDVTHLSVTQVLHQVVGLICTLPIGTGKHEAAPVRLGITGKRLSRGAILKKALNYRYLMHCVVPNLRHGSIRELAFPLARLGQQLLRQGYSAELMRAIYLQDDHRYGLCDRAFLGYPLHRAIYHRLQILTPMLEAELKQRLSQPPSESPLKVMTAPSGYALDLWQPLQRMARASRHTVDAVRVVASDLDPDGLIRRELLRAFKDMGISIDFVRGDLASSETRERLTRSGPYDVVVFVGLSTWMTKTHLTEHLRLIRDQLLMPSGVLFTDCFSAQAFALSGRHLGFKASYYTPREFAGILEYCGFDAANITWKGGSEGINHVFAVSLNGRHGTSSSCTVNLRQFADSRDDQHRLLL